VSFPSRVESFRAARRLAQRVDAEIGRRGGTPAPVVDDWRRVRTRIVAISSALALPRVIELASASRPAGRSNRALVAQVDRAVIALDEFLAVARERLNATDSGAEFQALAARLPVGLLMLRQRALASEPTEQLSRTIGEIESITGQLTGNTAPGTRVYRGEADLASRDFERPAQEISKLRGLMVKP